MKWYVAAPFSRDRNDQWLGRFVPPGRHEFESIPARYQHERSRSHTDGTGWVDYVSHGLKAHQAVAKSPVRAGLITCLPQLPLVAGARQRLALRRQPILAWAFNLGHLPGGAKRRISQFAFEGVARFVVHSRAEVGACSEWLQMPASRFQFVPLQRAVIDPPVGEDVTHPYIIAMGSAGRDYRLLFSVLAELKYRAVIVTAAHAVAGLTVPSNVEVRSGLTIEQCHELLRCARFSVTPVSNIDTASGQVTLLDAMMFSKAQVVTACPGSVDYLAHESEALLVAPGDRDGLAQSIRRLWDDAAMRATMGASGRERMVREFSDPVVGIQLGRILDELCEI